MPIEIRSDHPPNITIHHGRSVLVSDTDAGLRQPSQKGLYFLDTRLISEWRITANGQEWELMSWGNESYCSTRIILTNPRLRARNGEVKRHSLRLAISRSINYGMQEDLELVSYEAGQVSLNLEIAIHSDFYDLFEVKRGDTVQRSGITTDWSQDEQTLSSRYRKGDFFRAIIVRIHNSDTKAVFANGKIVFPLDLAPRGTWRACLLYEFVDGGSGAYAPLKRCVMDSTNDELSRELGEARHAVAKVSSSNPDFDRLGKQAAEDAVALRIRVPHREQEILPAGGVPWYLTVFGRDSIIASLQYQLIDPDFSRGALDLLGSLQATQRDDFRDAEPGKILHEMRHGEMAHFNEVPHSPYYGTADATPLYLILLHAAWKRTGDRTLLERHLLTAKNCLSWIDQYGDRDGDGFQEYQTRSPQGYENQSWKDAHDAILYPDGKVVKGPKALCELQGYVFGAWRAMAEVFDELGDGAEAARLRRKADQLRRRFNEAFWDDEAGFYALALDGDKKKVMSVASNPGHCLWSGIVPKERAERTVRRLLEPDMWSGWGIRTLSAQHVGYNPLAYQKGSVWPHDNSIIALGMKRYGFHAEASRVAQAVCAAGSYFAGNRLPELFAGIDRQEVSFPVRYLGANVPQAWASGSIFFFIQSLIGFEPDLPRQRLRLDPHLPEWLPDLRINDLRLGDRRIDLRFWREDGVTRVEVAKGDGRGVIANSGM